MTLRVATLNLYHFAEPGIWWYHRRREGESAHTEESWAAKCAWLSWSLGEMNADVVGFQEVVSVEALRSLCEEAGYPHFATVTEPHFLADDPQVYNRPVNAIASRWPMTASAIEDRDGVARTLGLSHDRSFRRPPVKALVQSPEFGEILVYCCHLKSPGVAPTDTLMAGHTEPPEEPDAAARWTLEALSRAHGYAVIQRVLEASILYHEASQRIAENPRRPLIIMGDLNDTPESPALSALTPYRAFERDGGAGRQSASGPDPADRYRLIDAWRLAPRLIDTDRRTPTHREAAEGAVIDHVLASSALHPWSPERVGLIIDAHVHDAHFHRADPVRTSDHAAVSVTIEPL